MAKIDKRFPLPDDLTARIGSERARVQHYARTGESWPGGLLTGPRATLGRRLELLKRAGLFYPGFGNPLQITHADLMAAQAEVARSHGLTYKDAGTASRWEIAQTPDPTDAPLAGRTRGYLGDLISADVKKGIPKVDLALLAHAFQIPIAVMEAEDVATVEAFAAIAGDVDLLASGAAFLEAMAGRGGLVVMERQDWLRRQGEGAPGDQVKAVLVRVREARIAPVQAKVPLVLAADVQDSFGEQSFSVLAMARREGEADYSLITTADLTEESLWHRGECLIPHGEAIEAGDPSFALSPAGRYEVVLIAATADLTQQPCYRRTLRRPGSSDASTALVTTDDLEALRRTLLGQHPASWTMHRLELDVVAA